MNKNFDVSITSEGFLQLYYNDIPASEVCSVIRKLNENVYLLETPSGKKIWNPIKNEVILIGHYYVHIDSDCIMYKEENKFKFIEFKDFERYELQIGDDLYCWIKYGNFILYEGKLYDKGLLLVNLVGIETIKLVGRYKIFKYSNIIIFTDNQIKTELYCIPNIMSAEDIIKFAVSNRNLLICTSNSDYLFDNTGNLIFCGQYGEYFRNGLYKVSNEQGNYLILENKLIGPIAGFSLINFIYCYESSRSLILLEDEKILHIDLENLMFYISNSNIKGLKNLRTSKYALIFVNRFDERIYVLTDGENNYFYSLKLGIFDKFILGNNGFVFRENILFWFNHEEGISQFEIDCDDVLDHSFLEDSILVIAKKLNDYLLISSKHGIIIKSKKSLAFYRNWGSFVLIDPRAGKKINLIFYNDKVNKVFKFPFKINSVDLNNSGEYFRISLDGDFPNTELEIYKYNKILG